MICVDNAQNPAYFRYFALDIGRRGLRLVCFFIQQSKARLETKRQNHAWALYRLTGTYLKLG